MTNITNIGYLPVYNYIVKIEVLDDEKSTYESYINNMSEYSIYITKNFKVMDIINYLDDKYLEQIDYEIDEFSYYMYKHLHHIDTKIQNYHPVQKSYKINKIYNDHRYYYKTFERAVNENFMEYKLYTKIKEGYSGIHTTYHENGHIKEKYFHNNGIKEGLYQLYYKTNQIEKEINYVNGLKHGESMEYNGSFLDKYENYNMGKLHGLCIYNNHGRLSKDYKVEINYKNGAIDGIYKKYYPHHMGGQLQIECNFKDNKYFGMYKEYNINGDLLIECDYKTYNKEIELKDIE
mgnify:CR=1 FL=1